MKMNDILNKLENLPNNIKIVAAVSGGPDSMALLNLLNQIKNKKNIQVICAHVNHKLRKESKEEAKMVQNYCQKNNLIFEYIEINNYQGNTEEFARKKRYEFFENLIKKYSASYLLTAHHGDDLTETIIMRLIRGASFKGYAGFKELNDMNNYKIYRPLINKTKDEILNYVQENKIPYVIDKTNNSSAYTRNRIRKYILPKLKQENKNVHLKFLEFSESINEIETYLETQIKTLLPIIYKNNKINIKHFLNQENIIQKKLIHHILQENYKNNINKINDKHVSKILSTVKNKLPNKKINLPDNKIFIKSYNNAWIEEKSQTKAYDYTLNKKITLPNQDVIEIIETTNDTSNYVTKINSKEIKMPLHVRTRKKGDTLILKGLNKHKKLKDIFINEKIPLNERNLWPVLTDNEEKIIWLPGLKKTKFDRENTKNYDIIIRYKKKGSL